MMTVTISLGAGATEAEIQQALNDLPNNGRLVLAAGESIEITNTLLMNVADRSISLDLNGSTLHQAGDIQLISVVGAHAAGEAAALGQSHGNVTVTYASADKVSVGQWIKVYSDDVLPNDQGEKTHLGQAMQVSAVKGDTLTLTGSLLNADLYVTNVRASAYTGGTVQVGNGILSGDADNPEWSQNLINVRSVVGAQLDHLIVRDGTQPGINIVDSVNAHVTQSAAFDMLNVPEKGWYGKGVQSSSSYGTVVDGFYGQNIRHATDTHAWGFEGASKDPSGYGADIGMDVRNVVVDGATATAFSWHSEGRLGSVHDSVVFNSWGVLGARGIENEMYDVAGAYNQRGVQFFEYGLGDGSHIAVRNLDFSDLSVYGFNSQGNIHDNLVLNSRFEVSNWIKWSQVGITVVNSTITYGSSGQHTELVGSSGVDRLLGTINADAISGAAGNDYIWGGAGRDILVGGTGSDRFAYLSAAEGGDTIMEFSTASGGDTIDLSVLAIKAGWTESALTNGNIFVSQVGLNTVIQVKGADGLATLATLVNTDADAVTKRISFDIVVTWNDGTVTPVVEPVAITKTGTSKADVIVGDASSKWLIDGSGGNDTITTSGRDDWIRGNSGADRISSGGGDDLIVFSGKSDGADNIDGGAGTDTIKALAAGTTIGLSSLSGVEAISSGGFANVSISGSSGDDNLNLSAVKLDGITGVDLGAGNDVFKGTAAANTVTGGLGNDNMEGGSGNDVFLIGRYAGIDTVDGGAGNDIIRATATDTAITWDAIENVEKVSANGFTGVKVVGTQSGDMIDLTGVTLDHVDIEGGGGNDTMMGTSAADTINGGYGADVLVGGNGDDLFLVDRYAGSDKFNGGEGYDVVRMTANDASLSFSAITGVEMISAGGFANIQIVGGGSNDTMDFSPIVLDGITAIAGGAGNDSITGTAGADTIVGSYGDDVLAGGSGNDVFLIGRYNGIDAISGGRGRDVVGASSANVSMTWGSLSSIEEISSGGFKNVLIAGTVGKDLLDLSGITLSGIAGITGGNGNDTIRGSDGADRIIGGMGKDALSGDGGADLFVFTSVYESRGSDRDEIIDFGAADRVDLSAIDARSDVSGDQRFDFLGEHAFTGSRGELRVWVDGAGDTHALIDLDGNLKADMDILISGRAELLASDFLL
jgi:Ca2+-binding RTX toxin-like protein